jgi:hypothetical protein
LFPPPICRANKKFPPRSHRQKRKAKIRRDIERGVRDPDEQDPFEIFVSVTDIRYMCASLFDDNDLTLISAA